MGLFEVIKGSGLCFCLQLHRKRPEAETAEGTNVQSPLSPPSVLRSVFTHTVTAPHRVLKHTHTHQKTWSCQDHVSVNLHSTPVEPSRTRRPSRSGLLMLLQSSTALVLDKQST